MTLILAHGLGGRSDLPVPLALALWGGAAAVLVSFFALGAFWSSPRLRGETAGRPLPAALAAFFESGVARTVVRAIALFMFLATLVISVIGSNSSASNPAPTWLYVWLWVGLVPLSLLFGPVWRVANPLRTVSAGLARLTGDPEGELTSPLPERLGLWPATVSVVIFVWLELVYDRADDPLTVFVFVAAYSLVHIVQAQRYGQAWYSRGDGFEVYSTLIGHLAPIGRRSDGQLVFRNPLDGLLAIERVPGLLGFVCVLLGSTAFDGLTRTPWWEDLSGQAERGVNLLYGTLGLLGCIVAVAATYIAATSFSGRFLPEDARRSEPVSGLFAHSLMPIAVGYTIAHYFSLLVFQGQAGYILASDPLGDGSDLLGISDWRISYVVLSAAAIALVQVAAIVIGHIVGVASAHDRSVGLFQGANKTRAQYPLLLVMVLYTVAGIALLVGS
ncbi:MAG: hypothetical protein ACLGIB_02300 [Actinomycetota bacterium]